MLLLERAGETLHRTAKTAKRVDRWLTGDVPRVPMTLPEPSPKLTRSHTATIDEPHGEGPFEFALQIGAAHLQLATRIPRAKRAVVFKLSIG